MESSPKEIAFLRGLIEDDWTARFTDVFDKKCKIEDPETFLYLNAGTGNHALGLRQILSEDSQMFAVCETSELQQIAQEKATALKSDLDFSTSNPLSESDYVLTDLSLERPENVESRLTEASDLSKKDMAFFLPTAGSFGEVFSYLWEVFLDLELLDRGPEIERLISELPSVSDAKGLARGARLRKVDAQTKSGFLEFENGKEFVESPLISHFLMPSWLGFLAENEKEQVIGKLAQKIDDERDDLSFRVTVKATVVTGRQA